MTKIIMLDGMSGSGKGTAASFIHAYLRRLGKETIPLIEPTHFLGETIRRYRALPREQRSPHAELHLFLADRAHLVDTFLRPKLQEDEDVTFISDRGFLSTCVYQQSDDISLEEILKMHHFYPAPDMTLLFVCEPETALARIEERVQSTGKPRSQDENLVRLALYKKRFEDLAARLPRTSIVYAEGSPSSVQYQVECHLNALLCLEMNKAVFFDKDGTLVSNADATNVIPTHFIYEKETVEGLKKLQNAGYKLIVISNQPWIARGRLTREETEEVFQTLKAKYAAHGVYIDDYFYCPHASGTGCTCKKPGTGLLEEAAKKYEIDTRKSYFVGDREKDIQAGRNFGLKTCLVQTGDGKKYAETTKATVVCDDVNAFAHFVQE